jgi:hypothetical protein
MSSEIYSVNPNDVVIDGSFPFSTANTNSIIIEITSEILGLSYNNLKFKFNSYLFIILIIIFFIKHR